MTTVSGTPRTPLLSDAPPCPNDTPACRLRAYIVAGDPVIVGPAASDYVCILFTGSTFGSVAFIRRDQLAPPRPLPRPALSAWTGTWRQGDNTIHLRVQGSTLVATGDAYWPSANPTLKDRPGGPNIGEMSGTATPNGNVVTFAGKDAYDCTVTLALVPPHLVALDNGNCGGNNVHFTGLFRQ